MINKNRRLLKFEENLLSHQSNSMSNKKRIISMFNSFENHLSWENKFSYFLATEGHDPKDLLKFYSKEKDLSEFKILNEELKDGKFIILLANFLRVENQRNFLDLSRSFVNSVKLL